MEELTASLQFFIELATYVEMKAEAPSEKDIVTKKFHGETLNGVVWMSIKVLCYS